MSVSSPSNQTPAIINPRKNSRVGRSVSIAGTGSYVPEKILTNEEISRRVDTSDEWITTRTGIKERRIAAENEFTSDMAAHAATRALAQAGLKAGEVDLIIVATITPDTVFPSTACWVQKKIGASRAVCFDIQAACSGFLFALETAQQFITSGTCENALVIGAEKLSSIVDWTDRNTCVLFGDGAAAAVLSARGDEHGILHTVMGSNGELSDILGMPGGGCMLPISQSLLDSRMHYIKMNGKEVFKQAVVAMAQAAQEALEACGLKSSDIACVIPHQANNRIIEAVSERLEVPLERFHVNVSRYGNTSAAAVAIALDEAARTGRFKRGDYILMVVFGGGLTWAACVVQW
ncbi:MAG: beta-ketoacyl-ACP synthase III [Verrucomicrobiae bacterium]|nr:beta-ketoacyl-ACP synthase III [Verrucomicrobiae bacterium]